MGRTETSILDPRIPPPPPPPRPDLNWIVYEEACPSKQPVCITRAAHASNDGSTEQQSANASVSTTGYPLASQPRTLPPAPPPAPPPPVKTWTAHDDIYASSQPNHVARAAYFKADGTALFFANTLALHVMDQHTKSKPAIVIFQLWPNLLRAGIPLIDAVLPDPHLSTTHHINIFWNDQYVRLNELTGKIVDGPHRISETWHALREAGFSTVDAVFLHPSGSAVFFSRDQYATVTFDLLETGIRSTLIDKGSFATRWPSLSGFEKIDYVLVDPKSSGRLTFFSDEECVSTDIGPSVDAGGLVLREESSHHGRVTDCWEALKRTGLY